MSKDITIEEWRKRKDFVGFTDEDAKLLKELGPIVKKYAEEFVDSLFDKFLITEETKKFFAEKDTLNHVKRMQKEYFIAFTEGKYEEKYLESRIHLGKLHERIGLEPRWYMGGYSIFLQSAMPLSKSSIPGPSSSKISSMPIIPSRSTLFNSIVPLPAYKKMLRANSDAAVTMRVISVMLYPMR